MEMKPVVVTSGKDVEIKPVTILPMKKSEIDGDLRKFAFIVQELESKCLKRCCDACQRWNSEFVETLKEGDLEQIKSYLSEDFNQPECQK